jgi:type II secretory pathway component PulK
MALIVVLGFLAAMSLIVIGVVSTSRSTVQAATRHLVRAQAQLAIEGAVDYAANVLVAARGTAPALLIEPEVIELSGWRIRISVRPERGKVDVNYADQVLLATLFGRPAHLPTPRRPLRLQWRTGAMAMTFCN